MIPFRCLMARHRNYRTAIVSALLASFAPASGNAAAAAQEHDQSPPHDHAPLHVVLPDISRIATLHKDGSRIRVPIEHRWRAMCSGDARELAYEDLVRMAIESSYSDDVSADAMQAASRDIEDEGGLAGGTFDIVFDIGAGVSVEAVVALARVEAFFEQQFSDPVTLTINVEFDNLPGNVLGAASTPFVEVSWSESRDGLQSDMDESDVIQNFLPPGSRIPVRYNGLTNVVTQETRVFWSLANFRAAIGSVGGDAGSLRFNDSIAWDYDPDDGVVGFSFVDVMIHEVGHTLGFGSGADFRIKDMEVLDIFRFQRTNGGAADHNPDTYNEFRDRPRLVSNNTPNNDANSDIIIAEYRMSDGHPFQASHFRDQSPPIGIMDPVIGQGQTFAPGFLRSADKRMFDAIGWDR
jgi:hypothetical protein